MKISNTSERLKQLMQERGLRQIDILKLTERHCKTYGVKMNKSDLSQYCSGKVEPNQDKLFILSEALNVNISWLMGYDVPIEPMHFAAVKRDYCIYKSLEEGLRSFDWEIESEIIDDEKMQYVISNSATSITVPEKSIEEIESRLKQFLIKELKNLFVKQNELLFESNDENSTPANSSLIEFPMLDAAHTRTDKSITDADRKHDEDIMDEENF